MEEKTRLKREQALIKYIKLVKEIDYISGYLDFEILPNLEYYNKDMQVDITFISNKIDLIRATL